RSWPVQARYDRTEQDQPPSAFVQVGGCSLLVVEGAPGRIRTCDRRIRSPVLYPAELRAPGPQVDLRLCKIQHVILDRLRVYQHKIPARQGRTESMASPPHLAIQGTQRAQRRQQQHPRLRPRPPTQTSPQETTRPPR